jgi:hypothetical protein
MRSLVLLAGLQGCLMGLSAETWKPEQFSVSAAVDLPASSTPVRVVLPRRTVADNDDAFASLRLFDPAGREIPYAIFPEQEPSQEVKSFAFRVIGFKSEGRSGEILLAAPEQAEAFQHPWSIRLLTPNRNFQKKVVVSTSDDLRTWRKVSTDSWFDFSAQTDFRRDLLNQTIPPSRYVRINFSDETKGASETAALRLHYRDLEFTAAGTETGDPFRIDRVEASFVSGDSTPPKHEYIHWDQPSVRLEANGDSLVSLGEVNLPSAEMRLEIDNPYYYRRVLLQGAFEDRPDAYTTLAEGTLYRIPGTASFDNLLTGPFPRARYLRLKILNGDNPPLQIRTVDLAWRRSSLYFVPETTGLYVLRWGGAVRPAPRYELFRLLPTEPRALARFPSFPAQEPQANPDWRPIQPQVKTDLNRWFLRALVVVLGIGLAAWAYTLMRKLSDPAA